MCMGGFLRVCLPCACSALRDERRALGLLKLTTKAGGCFMGARTRTSERAGCASNYLCLQPSFSVLKIISLIVVIGFIPIPVPASVSLVTPASKDIQKARLHSAPWRAQCVT